MEIVEKSEVKGIKFSIYFRPNSNGGNFWLFVGGIKRASYPTLRGAQGARLRIILAK